ncbi:MAG: hypothetical protein K2M00_02725 [Muribaculaceae bacterium]|nr:hypothetical protein [Muribaculaceae bacterium]
MKKLFITLATACLGLAAMAADPVAITFKTNINKDSGESYSFHFYIGTTETTYIDVDCGYGPVEYEITPAVWNPETQSISATPIVCQVSTANTVTIYADPMLIDYFDAEGCYISEIDFGECYNIEIINLQHNELKALDLSPYTKLSAIYLSDNPFTKETPLVIGDNHPDLMILEVDIVDWISPDFDIATYSNLVTFDGYACRTLSKLTPSGCPKLMSLSVDMTQVAELDVTHNPYLQVLNIEDSRITEIDLSKCPNLTQFYCSHGSPTVNPDIKLKSMDLTHNPLLRVLFASDNNFTSVDISKNPELTDVFLSYNLLTEINIDNCPEIYNLDLSNNNFSFKTLPLPRSTFLDYRYSQRPMKTEKSYPVGAVLDFSDRVLREGSTTSAILYSWNRGDDLPTQLDQSYYKYEDGKVTLLKEYADSVYVSFGNNLLPEYRLTTQKFMVKSDAEYGKPSLNVTFTSSLNQGEILNMRVGIEGATEADPRKFMVSLGNGQLMEFTATTDTIPDEPNVSAPMAVYGQVGIYTPEGEKLTALGINDLTIHGNNFSAAADLLYLTLANCNLYEIDLSLLKYLRSLDLSGNNFIEISLASNNGAFDKTSLSYVNLSHNRLADITLHEPRTIKHLDLSYNDLEEFGYRSFDEIEYLDLSHNHLSLLEMGYMASAQYIDLSYNEFESLILPPSEVLSYVNISHNKIPFSTMPYLAPSNDLEYVAAPQQEVLIPTRGPGANLSSQCRTEDGHSTVFTWITADGKTLTPDVDYTIENGVTHFINTSVGKVHCDITNAAWPMFSGENVMKTNEILADKMPEHVLASFTTPVGGEYVSLSLAGQTEGTTIYFDWAGNGEVLEQYMLGTTYRLFDATTVAGANVKVYSYDETDKVTVFSLTGATMTSLDASNLKYVTTFTICEAGLTDIVYPPTENIEELNLSDNNFESIDLSMFPNAVSVIVSNNHLTSLDFSKLNKLRVLGAAGNEITEINPGDSNPDLWGLYLLNNKLTEIDLSHMPALQQLMLSHNELSSIDVTPCSRLTALRIDNNNFTFATLPDVASKIFIYEYWNQHPLTVECVDGKVDLSEQASVNDTPTVYRWFIGVPEFDENNELVGNELVAGEDYTLENGVTTFNGTFDNAMCVMTNSTYPLLYLYTNPMKVEAGVADTCNDALPAFTAIASDGIITVKALAADGTYVAVHGLDGRLLGSAEITDGNATVRNLPAGVAIVTMQGQAIKVAVK